jgi:hypothetical protein
MSVAAASLSPGLETICACAPATFAGRHNFLRLTSQDGLQQSVNTKRKKKKNHPGHTYLSLTLYTWRCTLVQVRYKKRGS